MPGVPGAGLSGLFYMLSALVAILVELVATVRGRSSVARWRVVIRHSSLAVGIVLSITVAYSGVKFLFPEVAPQGEVAAASASAAETSSNPFHGASLELLPIAPVLMTVGALALLLGFTLLLGLAVRGRSGEPVMQPAIDSPAEESSEAIAA